MGRSSGGDEHEIADTELVGFALEDRLAGALDEVEDLVGVGVHFFSAVVFRLLGEVLHCRPPRAAPHPIGPSPLSR